MLVPVWLSFSAFCFQAIHKFDAESEKELSLAVGDYVVVRKVFGLDSC